jgi:hypothetical protein
LHSNFLRAGDIPEMDHSFTQCLHSNFLRAGDIPEMDHSFTQCLHFNFLCAGDIPVDLVAGTRDGVIPPHNIRIHFEAMKAAGLEVRSLCFPCRLVFRLLTGRSI